jgi:probable F420-dependent oxidoreductase
MGQTAAMTQRLDGTGIWSASLRYGDPAAAADAAAELEDQGWSALWIPDVGGDLFAAIGNLLAATSSTTVATGILNLWMHDAEQTAAAYHAFVAEHGPRLLVGIGVSHAPLIDAVTAEAGHYRRPLARTAEYLDALDAASPPLPAEDRVLAALGPKMLELARTRSAGSHPYLVTPEHTAIVREALGPAGLVAPEQAVVLETDAEAARAIAREHLAGYLGLPNYSNNWKRIGVTDEDIADGGSDRLVDALVAWGDEAAILARVQEHRDAGADHVCVQVLTGDLMAPSRDEWRRLAPALLG